MEFYNLILVTGPVITVEPNIYNVLHDGKNRITKHMMTKFLYSLHRNV